MKLQHLSVAVTLLFLAGTGTAWSQAAFDIAKFVPPSGWKSEQKESVWSFTTTNNQSGGYCVIGLYRSVNSSGELAQDFQSDWQSLVARPLGISAVPEQSEGIPKNGFRVMVGAGTYIQNNAEGLALLTTFSNGNQVMSFVTMMNDTTYLADYRKFYAQLTLAGAIKTEAVTSSATTAALSGTLAEYIFTPPPGWTVESGTESIVLSGPDKASMLTILPLRTTSGNLEADMQGIFWEVFPGWQVDQRNIDHHIYTKGVSSAGWEYYKQELGISKVDNRDIEIYGFVFLAKLGSRIGVIAGTYANSMNLLDDVNNVDWQLFYHSLNFKGYHPPSSGSTLAKEILGSWLVGGSTGMVTYEFAANGHYASGSAFSTSNRVDDYTVKEHTTSWVGDGTYTLNGSELTMINAKTKIKQVAKVRIIDEREYTDEWIRRLCMLEKSTVDGKLYEVKLVREK